MKIYVNKDQASRKVISEILDGNITNITATVSKYPSVSFEIWGDYIKTVEYLKMCGCTEYVFPQRGDKK